MGKNQFLQQAIRLALANAAVASVALPVASANADAAKDASAGPPAPLLLAQANEPAQGAAASNAPATANTLQEVVKVPRDFDIFCPLTVKKPCAYTALGRWWPENLSIAGQKRAWK